MTPFDRSKEIIWDTYSAPPVQHFSFGIDSPGCSILRLDMIRSWASGNKYFKLKHALSSAMSEGATTIVSKGGMFSNHLAALSEACSAFDVHLVAVIRSYAPDEQNPAIRRLRANGHEVVYLSPPAYKNFDAHAAAELY